MISEQLEQTQEAYAKHYQKMMESRHFPRYHYVPGNWMNDTKLLYHDGEYHVFFQHNPNGPFWGTMHWGHTVSKDLVHWEPLPFALAPTPNSVDQDGCFTGDVFAHSGEFHILYTSVNNDKGFTQTQSHATSPDMITWQKLPHNPLAMSKPEGFAECWRDPCVWQEDDGWYMALGGEKPNEEGGVVFLYRSKDLKIWEYVGLLYESSAEKVKALSAKVQGFRFCECPDFFPLDGKHVILSTHAPHTYWQLGDYKNHRLEPQGFGIVDGGGFCSAKTLVDDKGRRISIGFLWSHWGWFSTPTPEQTAEGFAGVLSLPRELHVLPGNTLGIEPVEELNQLRGKHTRLENLSFSASDEVQRFMLENISGDSLELELEFEPASAEAFGVSIRCSSDFEETVDIIYNTQTKKLVDASLELKANEGLKLRIYIDRSIIEIFANGRICQTITNYPKRTDALNVAVVAQKGWVKVRSVDAWEMQAIR